MVKIVLKMTKKRKFFIFLSLILIIFITGFSVGPIMSKVEVPEFSIALACDNIEIREYKPILIAEVEVKGSREAAISEGFKILADFIFGNNIKRSKIKMTAPVTQKSSQKIKMTAPVTQKSSDKGWVVSFTMPTSYNIDTLPRPVNEAINIKEIPEKKMAVITFSGQSEKKNILKHERKLLEFLNKNTFKYDKNAIYAFYNPPWTLPVLKKNEVMFEIIN